ncbi:Rz-like lysis system protein LysB [Enterobacter sp. Bisph1]|uniref:Rz-like lysis system protein LysB n=1 Tax=Enterobacter sp. Bisph1 TaxID=1274399 RepID=UPI00057C24D1|nr:Rz-like lysis system protein LysB [Enterobacter sp. Bisph1]
MKAWLIALVIASLGLLWLVQQNHSLSAALAQSRQLAHEQNDTIAQLKAQLSATQTLADKNQQAQVALRLQLDAASTHAVQREQAITRLVNENDAFRRWYSTRLPDAVRRVHQRPACPSAGHCLQQLPAGQPVPDAGKRTAN